MQTYLDQYGSTVTPLSVIKFDEKAGRGKGILKFDCVCRRCSGTGVYSHYHGECYACGGIRPKWTEKRECRIYNEAGYAKLEATRAKRAETRRAKEQAKADAIEAERATHPHYPLIVRARKLQDDQFIANLVGQFQRWGNLTDKQAGALEKAVDRLENPEPVGEAPTGRVEVTGKIISIKSYEPYSYYGDYTYKMLVKLDNNACVFGTMPASLEADKGDTVTFTATFEPKADDNTFAIFKRPAKALKVAA